MSFKTGLLRRGLRGIALALALVIAWAVLAAALDLEAPTRPSAVPASTADSRYGVVAHGGSDEAARYFLDEIGVQWYLNFSASMAEVPEGLSFARVIRPGVATVIDPP